jgi:cell pole-organizing protein PopZ
MASNNSNTAEQVKDSEASVIDEPSMDEIMASIKKIIADDEKTDLVLEDREQYTHPSEHSNSNQYDAAADIDLDADLEADLKAAMEIELQNVVAERVVDPVSVDSDIETAAMVTKAPAVELDHQLTSSMSRSLDNMPLSARIAAGEPGVEAEIAAEAEVAAVVATDAAPSPEMGSEESPPSSGQELSASTAMPDAEPADDSATPLVAEGIQVEPAVQLEASVQSSPPVHADSINKAKTLTAEVSTSSRLSERVAKIRREVSQASSGLSMDERLEKYRVRGGLKMEMPAARPVAEVAPPVQPAQPVAAAPASPVVAAGPILPTSDAIAKQMAATMMAEKEQEIEDLLSNIMRPTIRKWLGDNLPRMVEKLVREEIEQVSRGKRAS